MRIIARTWQIIRFNKNTSPLIVSFVIGLVISYYVPTELLESRPSSGQHQQQQQHQDQHHKSHRPDCLPQLLPLSPSSSSSLKAAVAVAGALQSSSSSETAFSSTTSATIVQDDEQYGDAFEPHLNLKQKPMTAKRPAKNIIRPRYYSSELGIREKYFVGVMTAQENIETLATVFNRTTAHLVNKVKYFINADNVKSNFNLKNIVGFTDTREHLRPFHVLKYIADNYLDDYDFFLILPDTTYLNARVIEEQLDHLSATYDVYMGRKISGEFITGQDNHNQNNGGNDGGNGKNGQQQQSQLQSNTYCDLNAGILLSNGVIRQIRANLDWCVRNAFANVHSINIGKCVRYAAKIDRCHESWQGIHMTMYDLKGYDPYRDIQILRKDVRFNRAATVFPVTSVHDFYILHAYFSKIRIDIIAERIARNEVEAQSFAVGPLPNEVLEIGWPLGVPPPTEPETRHDLVAWTYLNATHSFMQDNEHNARPLPPSEMLDIQMAINKTVIQVQNSGRKSAEVAHTLEFHSLHSAYRRFDTLRGLDYRLMINFFNQNTRKLELKCFEIVKPLGDVEIVPSPYVTESTRIAILLPTFEHQLADTIDFVNRYEKICMSNQDNTFLMLVLLYSLESPSKGDTDIFYKLKTIALNLSEKYRTDGSRIAWVSIRLPTEFSDAFTEADLALSSVYGPYEILSLAITDLALRKIGLESLVLIASSSMSFKSDFLNRVRMNTIEGFQAFAPIGFMMYPCHVTGLCKECDTCDVSSAFGYFDRANKDVVSFYSRDYVDARKQLARRVPIVRTDRDIAALLTRADTSVHTIVDILHKTGDAAVHMLRAVEPNLRFGINYRRQVERTKSFPMCRYQNTPDSDRCVRFASGKQMGLEIIRMDGEEAAAVAAEAAEV